MRILFDTNTPAPLARALRRHQVTRTGDLKWSGLEDGELLDSAEEAGFNVLITCDQNIRHQQNFESRKLAVPILPTNHWPTIKPVANRTAAAVDFLQQGQIVRFNM